MSKSPKDLVLAAGRRLRTYIKIRLSRSIAHCGRDIHVGARTTLWAPKSISIGDHVYIGKDVHVEANCKIGSYCLIANRVAIVGRRDHDHLAVGFPIRYAPWIGSPISSDQARNSTAIIEDEVWIGYGAVILTEVTIGRGSIVAAGSVVTADVPRYSIVAGNPARVVKPRFSDENVVQQHEYGIEHGEFRLSERGHDFCTILPKRSPQ